MVSSCDSAQRTLTWFDTARDRSERALLSALSRTATPRCPPTLASALNYAVFPGGARLRPTLCVVSAVACGDARPAVVDASAAAVELMHCASLVHDDLPCFDDADFRRGRRSLHKVYGDPVAVLTGDALIVLAFQVLAGAGGSTSGLLVGELARASGAMGGIAAGQAWEVENDIPLGEYHRAKTGSLFEAAAAMGAIASGKPPSRWRRFGEAVGRAYQVADDLLDVTGDRSGGRKPAGRDSTLGRPNLALRSGPVEARAKLEGLLEDAASLVPPCPGHAQVQQWLATFADGVRASLSNQGGRVDGITPTAHDTSGGAPPSDPV
jgi:geranylgeranyl diphosphate synthase type II